MNAYRYDYPAMPCILILRRYRSLLIKLTYMESVEVLMPCTLDTNAVEVTN